MKWTHQEKKELFKAGSYRCEVPPVTTALWSINTWITWVDSHGEWV